MKRIYGIPGLLLAFMLVWTSFGFVHGASQTGRPIFAAGAMAAAASLFLLAFGFPGFLKTRKAWTIALAVWLLVVAVALWTMDFL